MKCEVCGYTFKRMKQIYVVQIRSLRYYMKTEHCPNCGCRN